MGSERPGYFRRPYSLSAMWLLFNRVSANDAQIYDSGAGRPALRAQDYSEGILLRRLPLHLEQRGRTHHRTSLASVLPGPRARQSDGFGRWRAGKGKIVGDSPGRIAGQLIQFGMMIVR